MRFESEDFLEAANDALDDLSEFTGFYERFVGIQLKGGQVYYDLRNYVHDGFIRANFVFDPDSQMWLDPWDVGDFVTSKWETSPGTPQKYLLRGLFWLGLYPRPSSDTGVIRVYYDGLAPHFKDSSSVLSDLPDDYVTALDDYILYDINASPDGDAAKSLVHWSSYAARRKSLKDHVDKRIESRVGRLGGRT